MAFNMALKTLLLALTIFQFTKVTFGKIDCDNDPFENCKKPKVFDEIPLEALEFNYQCEEVKTYIRCLKEWQDECGTDRIVFYRKPGLFEAMIDALSDLCEEGTLLYTIATNNLKCYNETFSKTKCTHEAEYFVQPLLARAHEEEDYTLPFFCLEETHRTDCVLRALSENCGKIVEEATLDFLRRAKTLDYTCSVEDERSLILELDNLKLSEDKKRSMTLLLEKFIADNED